jgi:hypothetical protein
MAPTIEFVRLELFADPEESIPDSPRNYSMSLKPRSLRCAAVIVFKWNETALRDLH